ncbi:MAG: EamA family transporter [Cyanobacteriota bacterium]
MATKERPTPPIGTLAAIAAAFLFGATIGMVKLASALGAIAILGVRIVGATLFLTLLLLVFRKAEARSFFATTRAHFALISLSALLLGTAFFLFAWAFLHGQGRSIAQAYLLIPFTMFSAGWLFFAERPRPPQWFGVVLAAIGVTHALVSHRALSWVTIVQTLSLTGYFLIHRRLHRQGCTSMQLLVAEFWLLFPGAVACLVLEGRPLASFLFSWSGLAVIVGLWLVTTLAYISYIISNQYLSCAAFGMWGNLEPILIFLGSILFFGERIRQHDLLTYIPMFIGTLFVVCPGPFLHRLQPRLP